jgi:hypothetical protein
VINYNEASYEFIDGKKEDIYSDVTLRMERLPAGTYTVMCESFATADCLLRIYSDSNVTLTKFTGNSRLLMEHTFYFMSLHNAKEQQSLSREHDDWYFSKTMF